MARNNMKRPLLCFFYLISIVRLSQVMRFHGNLTAMIRVTLVIGSLLICEYVNCELKNDILHDSSGE